jgi:uncharacterized protein
MPNRIVHFEIEAVDRERAKKFYSQAFGWQMQQMGPELGDYVVVITGDPSEPGGINGGLMVPPPPMSKELNAFSCVVDVADIEEAVKNVRAAGGEVLIEKMDIPGIGIYARCKDTEGNYFTMLQPAPRSTG